MKLVAFLLRSSLGIVSLELKARGKTVVVISHDDRYFHVADRILKFNYGKMEQEILTSLKSSVVASTS